jgi:hypothetical protein
MKIEKGKENSPFFPFLPPTCLTPNSLIDCHTTASLSAVSTRAAARSVYVIHCECCRNAADDDTLVVRHAGCRRGARRRPPGRLLHCPRLCKVRSRMATAGRSTRARAGSQGGCDASPARRSSLMPVPPRRHGARQRVRVGMRGEKQCCLCHRE